MTMNNTLIMISANIAIMISFITILYIMQIKHSSFTQRVFLALVLGIIFGTILQYVYGTDSIIIKTTISWFSIIGNGYVKLLKMIVVPLIMVSIICAIVRFKDAKDLGKISILIIGTLMLTTGLSAIIAIMISLLFNLTAEGIQTGMEEILRAEKLNEQLLLLNQVSITERIVNLIPDNPFSDMAGLRPTSTIGVVIFSAFIGIAVLGVARKKPEVAEQFTKMAFIWHDIILRIVTLVLRITPFGILTLTTQMTATSSVAKILKLVEFIGASYVALILTFIMHLILLTLFGINPITFLKKTLPVFMFAFTSRTSAGTIPINVETQVKKLGINEGIANLSASLGSSIGQNGCAAIYPAMLAIMIAPTQGIDPTNINFILSLLSVILISSFGVAGVGGGATFASLMVLSIMNLPVGLAGLLISVEPLIDMGRTVINVSDSIVAGVVTARKLKKIDMKIYNS